MGKKSVDKLFRVLAPAEKEILQDGPESPFTAPKKPESPSHKKMFRDARRTLDERGTRGPRKPVKNWDESWGEYVKRVRVARRQALLSEHVPERVCPICHETKPRSRQWVVLDERMIMVISRATSVSAEVIGRVICKGCKMRHVG